MFVRTERLFLRPAWPEDGDELLPLIADRAVARNLSRVPWPYTAADAQAFCAQAGDVAGLPRFLITRPHAESRIGAPIVGCIGLSAGHDDQSAANLGYWIAQDHWGHGYATEAARGVISLARTLGHRRIEARHLADNTASGRVLAKLGFRRIGRMVSLYSPARGESAPGLVHSLDLGRGDTGGDGMGDGGGDGTRSHGSGAHAGRQAA